jgi:hypothetical protein
MKSRAFFHLKRVQTPARRTIASVAQAVVPTSQASLNVGMPVSSQIDPFGHSPASLDVAASSSAIHSQQFSQITDENPFFEPGENQEKFGGRRRPKKLNSNANAFHNNHKSESSRRIGRTIQAPSSITEHFCLLKVTQNLKKPQIMESAAFLLLESDRQSHWARAIKALGGIGYWKSAKMALHLLITLRGEVPHVRGNDMSITKTNLICTKSCAIGRITPCPSFVIINSTCQV